MYITILIALLGVAFAQLQISAPKIALELHNLSEEGAYFGSWLLCFTSVLFMLTITPWLRDVYRLFIAIACADYVANEVELKEGGVASIEEHLLGRGIQRSHIISGSLQHDTGNVYEFKLAVTGTQGNCRVMFVQAGISEWVDNPYIVYHHEILTEACPPH